MKLCYHGTNATTAALIRQTASKGGEAKMIVERRYVAAWPHGGKVRHCLDCSGDQPYACTRRSRRPRNGECPARQQRRHRDFGA